MGAIILALMLSGLGALILRWVFRMPYKWLLVICGGVLAPIFLAPLWWLRSLAALGGATPAERVQAGGDVSLIADQFDFGLWLVGVWLLLGIIACIGAIFLPRGK